MYLFFCFDYSLYFCKQRVKNLIKMFGEIGKWLLDISKYLITGYVLAKMFGQEDSTWVVIGAVVVAALLFVLGLYCLRKDKDKNNKKKGK